VDSLPLIGKSRVKKTTRSALWWLSLLGGMMMLSACSTVRPVNKAEPELQRLWQAHQRDVAPLHAWSIAGRLGIQTEHEGWHIAFHWQQTGDLYHIVLSNPLGQTSGELQGNPQGVTLLLADGRSVTADDPEHLLAQQFGWRVPIKGLYYWARGLPVPDVAETHGLDEEGRLQWLKQSGWHIDYRRYDDYFGKSLPTKIFLDNDALKVRLVIDEWTLP
jgi:outer membrane lipoprotein LolB